MTISDELRAIAADLDAFSEADNRKQYFGSFSCRGHAMAESSPRAKASMLRHIANELEAKQPITVGVLVEAGTVTEIRASHPEITVEVVDADVQDDEAQAEYANQRKAFDDLPHVVDCAL